MPDLERKVRSKNIKEAINVLNENLSTIARVNEWAQKMGYIDPKLFGEDFLRHHNLRPHKMMDLIRLKSIITHLKNNEIKSNHRVARAHSMPDEKALNNYTNYHLGYSPREIKSMPGNHLQEIISDYERKIQK